VALAQVAPKELGGALLLLGTGDHRAACTVRAVSRVRRRGRKAMRIGQACSGGSVTRWPGFCCDGYGRPTMHFADAYAKNRLTRMF
jgi:hypothetical protein